jgi:hypothetical protein
MMIWIGGDECEYGTQFLPQAKPLAGRKRWIAHGYVPSGTLKLGIPTHYKRCCSALLCPIFLPSLVYLCCISV